MPATARRALSSLYVLSKRAFSQHVVETTWTRSILHSKPTDPGENVRGSLEFVEWHNGGGLLHRSAHVDPTVFIEVGAIVHQNAIIGSDVHIASGSIVGPSVSIGQSTNIRYNAVLSNCSVGMSCVIHNGSCIGQDGFGFFVDKDGNMMKKPQMLHVRIGNHVEIGANSCIDRGSWRDTVVGDYTKIDNLIQIGHNVVIGKCCMLCGQVGIAGSVTIGDYCTLGGRVAVKDHVTISSKELLHQKSYRGVQELRKRDGGGYFWEFGLAYFIIRVRLAANSCVTKDLGEPGDYAGFPAVPIHQWRRQSATIRRLSKKDLKGSGS